MARFTLHRRVGPNERKSVFVCAHGLQRHVPPHHGVALLAIRAELAPVNIRMAVGTLRAHVSKDRLGVALHAVHLRVHAAERVARFIVVEFRNGPDGLPARLRMAIFAGNGQGAVRAARLGIRHTAVLPKGERLEGEDEQEHESERQRDPLEHDLIVAESRPPPHFDWEAFDQSKATHGFYKLYRWTEKYIVLRTVRNQLATQWLDNRPLMKSNFCTSYPATGSRPHYRGIRRRSAVSVCRTPRSGRSRFASPYGSCRTAHSDAHPAGRTAFSCCARTA